jgi:hypothetical protein
MTENFVFLAHKAIFIIYNMLFLLFLSAAEIQTVQDANHLTSIQSQTFFPPRFAQVVHFIFPLIFQAAHTDKKQTITESFAR